LAKISELFTSSLIAGPEFRHGGFAAHFCPKMPGTPRIKHANSSRLSPLA
jgi:hypothetical protein